MCNARRWCSSNSQPHSRNLFTSLTHDRRCTSTGTPVRRALTGDRFPFPGIPSASTLFLLFKRFQMERSLADELYSGILEPKVDLGQTSVPDTNSLDGEDGQWCEDGSSWNGSDGKFDPSSDLDREWQRRKNQFHAIGYRDGLIAGKEASAQEGFNDGFKESVVVGFNWGLVRGVTGALDCLPGELRKKIVSQETRNKFHDLYESVNKLSTEDALKVFYDARSKRRVKQGDLELGEQNSDGRVLDTYHEQLRSLIVESPAIEVQSRDKVIDVLSTGQGPSRQ